MQDDVKLVDRRRREAGVQTVPVEPADLGGVQVLEFDPPEGGLDVGPYCVLVSLVGALAHRVLHILQPPLQVLADGKCAGVEDEPVGPV